MFFKKLPIISIALQSLILLALFFSLIFLLADANTQLQWKEVWEFRFLFLKGWMITILLSLASLLLSLFFGIITVILRKSKLFIGMFLSKFYVEVIRGTPFLVQILFFFYVVANALGLENRYVAGVIMLSLFHGAYLAEMMRSGIDSISRTQLESARAIGLSTFQSYRYIIFPQAFRQLIPLLAGQFASIIKDSSLLSIIGINEVTNTAQQINSATYSTLESFLPLGIAYLALTLPISLISKKFEKRFRYET